MQKPLRHGDTGSNPETGWILGGGEMNPHEGRGRSLALDATLTTPTAKLTFFLELASMLWLCCLSTWLKNLSLVTPNRERHQWKRGHHPPLKLQAARESKATSHSKGILLSSFRGLSSSMLLHRPLELAAVIQMRYHCSKVPKSN